ncbi:hypothetical protein [Rhizobium metallidurans]|uniref:Uncharacterized protein n=1 Tax=Rhizobium metallidurans TaxID=1265931 RepID=A0A7W6GB66_9HYPH|nr:hypothetical protein [Rhizobium metallidurans]MBB3965333.1 hypothetical protein [Rhizobium metallidurans]
MRFFKTCLLLTLCALSTAAPSRADDYKAVSNTAMSITGDIAMDDFSITFETGDELSFSNLVADNFVVDGERVPASVYRVADPSDPELLNGNRLCGSGPVTYVANWSAGEGLSVIAVFTGSRAPKSSDGMCASYTFEEGTE